uniref:Uncharacterized protein n=1 Tax=Arundo donax TaxID=35708 RepID=A0A0A9BVT4_ARUDO
MLLLFECLIFTVTSHIL